MLRVRAIESRLGLWSAQESTRTFQYPLFKEYTLNLIGPLIRVPVYMPQLKGMSEDLGRAPLGLLARCKMWDVVKRFTVLQCVSDSGDATP